VREDIGVAMIGRAWVGAGRLVTRGPDLVGSCLLGLCLVGAPLAAQTQPTAKLRPEFVAIGPGPMTMGADATSGSASWHHALEVLHIFRETARLRGIDYRLVGVQRQEPLFLYIGCADSRVPANSVTGTKVKPGELFVHRNIANLVMPSDINAMSVLQYAVDVLDVKHVLVTGHYGCGGVKAARSGQQHGLVDHWLGPIRNVLRWNAQELNAIADPQARFDRLVELNVLEHQQAWARGRRPLRHGLVYDLKDGLLHEIATGIDSQDAAGHLADRRLSGVPAGPPPLERAGGRANSGRRGARRRHRRPGAGAPQGSRRQASPRAADRPPIGHLYSGWELPNSAARSTNGALAQARGLARPLKSCRA